MTVQHSALTGTSLHYTKIRTNAGAPGSAPLWIGDVLFDTVNNAVYVATGTAAISDWKLSAKASLQDNLFTIYDNSDVTKTFQFEASSIGTGTNRTLTVPDLSGILVLTTGNQTLSNKQLDNTNSLTILDSNLILQDDADSTKQARLQLSSITSGITRTYTLPDATTTLTGTLDTATISNKTNNNTNTYVAKDTNFTLQDDGDTTKQAQFQLSGLTTATTRTYTLPDANTTVVGTDTAQIITNKDIDGGTAANTRRITLPKDVKANLDALTRKQGTVVFASDQNKAYVDNGTSLVAIGSGSSGLYSTVDFEDNSTGGISLYNDGAVAIPVDGTGGVASSTFTVNNSSPLRGTYDGLFTKSAVNRQGEGFSLPIPLSNADLGKTIQVIFDIKTSANFVSGDMVFYVYDVTNSTLITPSQTILPTGTSSQYSVAFQATTGTSYRLIWHVATTSALAYTVEVDQISYTSVVRPVVAGVGDWIAYTPTISAGAGVATAINGRYKRIGDWNEYEVTFTSATAAASSVSISLPTGHAIDTTKILINSAAGSAGENIGSYSGSAGNSSGSIIVNTSTSTTLVYLSGVYGSTALIAVNGAANIGNSNQVSCYFRLPIVNQSSNITLASTSGAIEYQSNSSSTDADDTTSFVAGATGSVGILGVTNPSVQRKKRVQFSTPIQPTDRIVLEFNSGGNTQWVPMIGTYSGTTIGGFDVGFATLSNAGVGLRQVSSTTMDVEFATTLATISGTGSANWASVTANSRWRVAKYSAIGGAELAPATEITQGTVGYSQWTSYTPTITGMGVATSIFGLYRREGDSMRIKVTFTTATTTGSLASITLPSSYTINSSKSLLPSATTATTSDRVGAYEQSVAAANYQGSLLISPATSTTLIYLGGVLASAANRLIPTAGNNVQGAAAVVIICEALVPISGWN